MDGDLRVLGVNLSDDVENIERWRRPVDCAESLIEGLLTNPERVNILLLLSYGFAFAGSFDGGNVSIRKGTLASEDMLYTVQEGNYKLELTSVSNSGTWWRFRIMRLEYGGLLKETKLDFLVDTAKVYTHASTREYIEAANKFLEARSVKPASEVEAEPEPKPAAKHFANIKKVAKAAGEALRRNAIDLKEKLSKK